MKNGRGVELVVLAAIAVLIVAMAVATDHLWADLKSCREEKEALLLEQDALRASNARAESRIEAMHRNQEPSK